MFTPKVTDDMFESGKLTFVSVDDLQESYEIAMSRLGTLFLTETINFGEYTYRLNALHATFMAYLRDQFGPKKG